MDESIYYMISSRILCLRESKVYVYHSIPPALTHPSTELEQRDRLIDSQIYLKVLNQREVRTVIQLYDHSCPSATLLLASLLRVSVTERHVRTRASPP